MSGEEKKEGGEGGVRNTLVTSIAANIFDTLKSNDDIAAILNGVLDPARTDKVKLLISHHSLTSVREEVCSGGFDEEPDVDHQHQPAGLLAEEQSGGLPPV